MSDAKPTETSQRDNAIPQASNIATTESEVKGTLIDAEESIENEAAPMDTGEKSTQTDYLNDGEKTTGSEDQVEEQPPSSSDEPFDQKIEDKVEDIDINQNILDQEFQELVATSGETLVVEKMATIDTSEGENLSDPVLSESILDTLVEETAIEDSDYIALEIEDVEEDVTVDEADKAIIVDPPPPDATLDMMAEPDTLDNIERELEKETEDKQEIIKQEGEKGERLKTSLFEIDYKRQERVMSLFVPPKDYKTMHLQGFNDARIFIVQGPKYAGKLTCAIHLGLSLQGKIPPLTENDTLTDAYSIYEMRANALINKITPQHPRYGQVFSQVHLLNENIRETRQYLDTRDSKVYRAHIISRLNEISLSILDIPFDKLYQPEFTTSISTATLDAKSALRLKIYDPAEPEHQLIPIFIKQSAIQDHSIYIIENFQQKGFVLDELTTSFISKLLERNIYFILTTVSQNIDISHFPQEVQAISIYNEERNKQITFIEKIFTRYLKEYQVSIPTEFKGLTDTDKQSIVQEHLQWPYLIEAFYEAAMDLPTSTARNEILELAAQVGQPRQTYSRLWFEQLPNNAQFYALLVVLIEDIPFALLNEIYIESVKELRQSGINKLDDSREHGLEDILRVIKASITADGSVRLKIPAFEREVRQQIRNHHHLLWSLKEVLVRYIEASRSVEHWRFRRTLGIAIGRIGIYEMHNLETLLHQLAEHPYGGVVAVVGYSLDEICATGPEYYPFVASLLNRWTNSGDPDLMWAVGASIWRIYGGLAKISKIDSGKSLEAQQASEMLIEVKFILSGLIKKFDRFNDKALDKAHQIIIDKIKQVTELTPSDIEHLLSIQYLSWASNTMGSILHAIRQITIDHSEDMVTFIKELLRKENSNQRKIGLLAGRELFERNKLFDRPPLDDLHFPLLELIVPLLSFDEVSEEKEKTIDTFIETLFTWLKYQNWPDLIHTKLLYAVNRATLEQSSILCSSLSRHWLDSDLETAQKIGRALITRAYAIHGIPMDVPGKRRGLIVLDASHRGSWGQIMAFIGHQLYERLDTQVDTIVTRLGDNKELAVPGASVSVQDFIPEYAFPRILTPTLENLDPQEIHFVLVITRTGFIDLDDLSESPWLDRLIIASANSQIEWLDNIKTAPFNIRDTNLAIIEHFVRAQLAQSLATLDVETWWSGLYPYYPDLSPDDITSIVNKHELWIAKLDNITYSKHPDDVVRKIICTILWLASLDLSACIQQIKIWLTDKDENKKLIGGACGMALFRIYAYADPTPTIQTHAILLELALPLADIGWHAIYSVLQAARKWVVQPEWAERLTAKADRKPSEFLKFIEAIASEYYDNLTRHLTIEWKLDEDEDEEISKSIEKVLDHLYLHIAIGARQPLPQLEDGHRYALVIIDTNSNKKLFNTFINIACEISKKLYGDNEETTHLLIYHLGHHYPVSTPVEKPEPGDLIPSGAYRRPKLLGSLLEMHTPEQIGFVLLLAQNLPIDESDWNESLWRDKIYLYSHTNRTLETQLISQIPKYTENTTIITQKITNYLQERIGG